jgi:hypothetical protein
MNPALTGLCCAHLSKMCWYSHCRGVEGFLLSTGLWLPSLFPCQRGVDKGTLCELLKYTRLYLYRKLISEPPPPRTTALLPTHNSLLWCSNEMKTNMEGGVNMNKCWLNKALYENNAPETWGGAYSCSSEGACESWRWSTGSGFTSAGPDLVLLWSSYPAWEP